IVVAGEHSLSYKGEEGIRYNARDVSVMRGLLEGAVVLLSSVSPSVESVYNAKNGKYSLLDSEDGLKGGLSVAASLVRRPAIRLIDMRKERDRRSVFSKRVLDEIKRSLVQKEGFLIISSRGGYSLIRCEECGEIIRCKKCGAALVFYKDKNLLRCNHCGFSGQVVQSCGACGSFNVSALGAGAERLIEEAMKHFGAAPILLNGKGALDAALQDSAASGFAPLVIGRRAAASGIKNRVFKSALVYDLDLMLSLPDFRANERAFQYLIQASQLVSANGSLFIQTWNPRSKALQFLKGYDYKGFYAYEDKQRREMNYPPFSRMILFNVFAKIGSTGLINEIRAASKIAMQNIEILGPVEITPALKSYGYCLQLLMKSSDKAAIHASAKQLIERLRSIRGVDVRVDVDPQRIF
ncbi:MAG: primosomal protein N', partial [Nitrospirae bacterium]|nr:primosomal protein N' [Nitrospirota bacterium]